MNVKKVREIIGFYRRNFHSISQDEIYKWRAVKRFHDNWDINAENFHQMLEDSLSLSRNLLGSGNYFPRRMLLQNAAIEPETVRRLFTNLYNEDHTNWVERLIGFRKAFAHLNERHYPNTNHYQDHRAVLVYLSLRFPDIYYIYKYEIFKKFVSKIDYPFKPVRGRLENLTTYFNLCELLKEEIVKDSELLVLHEERLTENHYLDKSFNILTQDVIYSTIVHFPRFEGDVSQTSALTRLTRVDKSVVSTPIPFTLEARKFTNYLENEKRQKRLGDLGELLVLKYEKERLSKLGSKKEPIHVSTVSGDGEGYDILSFDELGNEMFIEVKTTSGDYSTPFFVTGAELEKSIREDKDYYLYRLYSYDEYSDSASFYIHAGNLKAICINPVVYKVKIKEN